jgi:hypothetical protein
VDWFWLRSVSITVAAGEVGRDEPPREGVRMEKEAFDAHYDAVDAMEDSLLKL